MHAHVNARTIQVLVGMGVLMLLLGVLSLYFQPEFLLTLANQVWGCF